MDEATLKCIMGQVKMVLGNYVHEDLEKIKDLVAKGISFEVAEFVVLGMDHAAIGPPESNPKSRLLQSRIEPNSQGTS